MNICGIDYSMNSPGVVIFKLNESLICENVVFRGFTSVKKNQTENILYYKKEIFKNNIEKFLWMNDNIEKFFLSHEIDYIALEGYAYGAKGHVFEIGEATGDLKRRIWQNNIPLRIYDPTSIKMFITGTGNADKELMRKYYDGKIAIESINEDIIDAYHITTLLLTELLTRKGLMMLQQLPEHQIKVFNRCTKTFPENLLARNFIIKE
jgi:Holliday junction resolvasome RuvABC endonuclease subunit